MKKVLLIGLSLLFVSSLAVSGEYRCTSNDGGKTLMGCVQKKPSNQKQHKRLDKPIREEGKIEQDYISPCTIVDPVLGCLDNYLFPLF